jgi:outer membrane protein assembly factor BamB
VVARQRGAVGAGLGLIIVIVVLVLSMGAGARRQHHLGSAARTERIQRIPAVESGLLPWQLTVPISREIVLPGTGPHVVILGGLGGSTSESGVFSLDTRNGSLRSLGALKAGVHDAAGAVLGARDLIFGGGTPTTVASLESFPSARLGVLPAPRSDAAAASIGNTVYLVGGYTGTAPDPTVLATTDGRSFQTVARLPVPVRYPALGSAGGKLYVFGGQAVTGPHSGEPVSDIQEVDPTTHTARVVAQMPEPLEASVVARLGGNLYLAGGDTTAPQSIAAGQGTLHNAVAQRSAGSPTLYTTSTIWAFQPQRQRLLEAGHLQVPVSHAGAAVVGNHAWIVGGESGAAQVAAVQMITPNARFGTAGAVGAGSPYFGGRLLVADRGNNRLLVLDTSNQVRWRFPSPALPHDRYGFFFPDDAFFFHRGTAIITNQEENETLQQIAYPSGRVLWEFGHPHQPGAGRGYLHEPDDAYVLKNGQVTVADAQNCRVLTINPNHTIAHQIGATGGCAHRPPATIGADNGDTPLANGDLLVSEVTGSWIDEFTPTGRLVWSTQLPISYPSDPQQLGPDRYLLADYAIPGQIDEFNRAGKILYRYDVSSGTGMLNQPSLVELLPSGVFMVNDDYRDRMAAIDPTTKALVWEYGVPDHAGRSPGLLRTPDGFDLLMANGSTPTHPATG